MKQCIHDRLRQPDPPMVSFLVKKVPNPDRNRCLLPLMISRLLIGSFLRSLTRKMLYNLMMLKFSVLCSIARRKTLPTTFQVALVYLLSDITILKVL